MLNDRQLDMTLAKVRRFEDHLKPLLFEKVGELDCFMRLNDAPCYGRISDDGFVPVKKGDKWGGAGKYCLFDGAYAVPDELDGRALYVMPHIGFREALFFVDCAAKGLFSGDHYCALLTGGARAGQTFKITIEGYAGHRIPGCGPLEGRGDDKFEYSFDGVDICVKNDLVFEFYFDLRTLNELAFCLDKKSFRYADVVNCLVAIHKTVLYSYEDTDPETFYACLRRALPMMKKILAVPNSPTVPLCGLVGHSHMDTAWLWHVGETINKCARTYSEALSLMDQYPEYRFVQSSALHCEFMRQYYPELFERMKKAVASGRYEPNGAVWVECDCNITSGEAMVRQFLWGQLFTRKYFNYTSDCFWLPDTFGYSAAIPQIMKGCRVKYFLTTKIAWNDTNPFPYDTFIWEGIDGSRVFAHFNKTHIHPDAENLITFADRDVKQKAVAKTRLISYGFGDGGGGPEFAMLEESRRCEDCDGVPRSRHMSVSEFMNRLESETNDPNVYRGELYLELHRGTLTNQHTIKRNNRKSELALRDLEFAIVSRALTSRTNASDELTAPLWRTLLLNQFHDILPGTAIHRAHAESRAQTGELLKSAAVSLQKTLECGGEGFSLVNTLSFDRSDAAFLELPAGFVVDAPCRQQAYTDLDGKKKTVVCGLTVPAFGSVSLSLVKGKPSGASAFRLSGSVLETPFAFVTFAKDGTIESFVRKADGRELRAGDGLPLNSLIMAEDVPDYWDNWNIDADLMMKFAPCGTLVSRELISDGPCCYIIRSKYSISKRSSVTQDMIFFADSEEVRFDTVIDWQDDHRFLKAAFDTSVRADYARHEIQYGHVCRPTDKNTSLEQARFEVVNHRFTDLSETRSGVALLNDCKYGISVDGGSMRLSLHKGGNRPDDEGDHDGVHRCVYSFLPHSGSFGAENVVRPAYELNSPVIKAAGEVKLTTPVSVDAPNVIVEAVKPCEDGSGAFVARMYECEGSYTRARLSFPDFLNVVPTNMLEEPLGGEESFDGEVEFGPFEIKTFRAAYK